MLDSDALFEILTDEGLDADWMEQETEIVTTCPLCNDHRQRLYFSMDTGQYICFNCDERGSMLDFLQRGLGWDMHRAYDTFRQIVRDDGPRAAFRSSPVLVATDHLPDSVKLPPAYRPLDERTPPPFLKYLERRHITPGLARSRHIGYAVTGEYQGRVITPVENGGHMYSYIARTILSKCPKCQLKMEDCHCLKKYRKVLNADPSHPSLTLYNYDWVLKSPAKRAVLMEGSFDALRLPDEGLGLMRNAISPSQLKLLLTLHDRGKEIIICLDPDKGGDDGTRAIAEALQSCFVPFKVRGPLQDDPSGSEMFDLADALNTAKSVAW